MSIYLDNAATTRVCPEAAAAAIEIMTENYANPSSTHTMGRRAKTALDLARKNVASALGCRPAEIYFTSCGTESDNWAVFSAAEAQKRVGKHIITSNLEHDAVRRAVKLLENRGYEVTRLPAAADGSVSHQEVMRELREDTALVTLMMVNNETGAVTDLDAISKGLKTVKSRALLHTDAVQGFLKVPFKASSLGADLISLSGHKIHAPKGIGALFIKNGINLPPLIVGGGQENNKRAGTEALPQIAAFGEAAKLGISCMNDSTAKMCELRDHCTARIKREIPSARILTPGAPHILSVSLPGYKSEVIMNFLEARDIYVSRSSACRKGGRSHVLEAMGLPENLIDGTIRLGFSRYNTIEEIDIFCDALHEATMKLLAVLR